MGYLKEIHIENYKSLKNVTVQFKDGLNIIIGKNGSGKSNLLEFIDSSVIALVAHRSIARKVTGGRIKIDSDYSYKIGWKNNEVCFKFTTVYSRDVEMDNLSSLHRRLHLTKSITIEIDTEVRKEIIKSNELGDFLLSGLPMTDRLIILENSFPIQILKFNIPNNLEWLATTSNYIFEGKNGYVNMVRGEGGEFLFITNLMDYINTMMIDEDEWYISSEQFKISLLRDFADYKQNTDIDKNLSLYSPIEEIRITPNVNIYKIDSNVHVNNLALEFKMSNNWVPWSFLSDGTKRLFYLISEICSQKDGLILIEEPELGVHPHQLYKLMQFIQEQSQYKQIIISTHSPLVLDTLEPNELDRITIAKAENGSSQFHKLTEEQIEKAKVYMHEEMDLSFYWLHSDLEGE